MGHPQGIFDNCKLLLQFVQKDICTTLKPYGYWSNQQGDPSI